MCVQLNNVPYLEITLDIQARRCIIKAWIGCEVIFLSVCFTPSKIEVRAEQYCQTTAFLNDGEIQKSTQNLVPGACGS
nr:MAG TPA: hypothetical protein [Caudoviricetes sp.]